MRSYNFLSLFLINGHLDCQQILGNKPQSNNPQTTWHERPLCTYLDESFFE